MEHWYVLWQMGKYRQQELLRQVQRYHWVREAGRLGERSTPIYGVLLSRLGEQLIAWGSYLSNRFRTPDRKDAYAGYVKDT